MTVDFFLLIEGGLSIQGGIDLGGELCTINLSVHSVNTHQQLKIGINY